MASPMNPEMLMRFATGYQASQVLHTVLRHGLPEHLKDGPKSSEEISKLANTHPENTLRLLRAAVTLGLFTRDPSSLLFSLTEISSRFLLDGKPLKDFLLYISHPHTVVPWCNLDKAVADNSYPHELAYGKSVWDFMAENPEFSTIFNKGMTSISVTAPVAPALLANYNFADYKHVIDIGGGHGALVIDILRGSPHLKGTTFDMPHVIEEAKTKPMYDFSDVKDRFSFAGGSFFESVPTGGDVYLMKHIIHDWKDDKAIEILKAIHKSMADNSRVVVIDRVIKEVDNDVRDVMLDLNMMVLCEAKERTMPQFHHIFNAAGLQITRTIHLGPTSYYAIEGSKI